MASVRHLEFEKFRFLSNFHTRYRNLHLCTKFDQNRIIRGWDMEIKLFSGWWPSAILNLRKLQFWPRGQDLHVILHLHSEICINRSIRRQDTAKNQFSIWRLSAILNLKTLDSNFHARNRNLHMCTKFDQNRIIDGWDMEINLFSKWRPSAIFSFRKLQFWSRPVLACDSVFPIQISH